MAVRRSREGRGGRAGARFDKPAAGFYHAHMKIDLTPHQEKFVAMKMKGGGYLSESEVVREALRVYELADQEDDDPELAEALREALRSPRQPYRRGHFAALARAPQQSWPSEDDGNLCPPPGLDLLTRTGVLPHSLSHCR